MSDTPGAEKKIAAGICGILLGALGVHKFILGYTKEGIIMLVVTLVGSLILIGPMVMGIIGLVEGIIYLTKSDADFVSIALGVPTVVIGLSRGLMSTVHPDQ